MIQKWLWLIIWLGLPCITVAQDSTYKQWQTRLIMAQDGDTIHLPAGVFYFKKSLSLEGKNNITIQGQGMGKTVLNFKHQTSGAEGIRLSNGKQITIQDLTVQEAKGDAIKAIQIRGITFRRVETEWTGAHEGIKGAYGLYPVFCQQVLAEHCQARGACDAGIYVGQSSNIVVRYCEVEQNVTGINLENSTRADVYGNLAMNNACGILVMDVPVVMIDNGGQIRVFDNKIVANNHRNFAPKGAMVAGVPSGSGIVVVATSRVEIFGNELIDNRSIGTGVFRYDLIGFETTYDKFNPYPSQIAIYNNRYQRQAVAPTLHGKLAKLRFAPHKVPHILYDGDMDPAQKGKSVLCLRNNQVLDQSPLFANIDAANGFKHIRKNEKDYNCQLPKLPKVWVGL